MVPFPPDYQADLDEATAQRAETKRYFQRLRRKKPKPLDQTVAALHEEVFAEVDCLLCANCCRTTSPVFTDQDIDRIAKRLRMKPAKFVEMYLHLDEEQDYVLNEAPCPFLGADYYCSIYKDRPKACREYPHTQRKRFHQVLNLTLKNAEICPATHRIVSRLKQELPA
ncbi:MAG: YkgJ family cysteine cluster protein [Bacteroidota bacterium]